MFKLRHIFSYSCFCTSLLMVACNNRQPQQNTSVQQPIVTLKGTTDITPNYPAIPLERLIVPGHSVGKTALGEDASALAALGKPDFSDAAMGKAWVTWYGKSKDEHNNRTELNVYTTYKDSTMRQKTVQQIRITSSYFLTADSIHVYSGIDAIRKGFPRVQIVGRYKTDGRTVSIYDDVHSGIAFEVADAGTQQICTGIIVHKSGALVTNIYIMLHPDMIKMP